MDASQPANQPALDALALVLSSSGFVRNERQSKFLSFLVQKQLEGRSHELKESVIGVEVFGRDPGYDPKVDGIVRTEAIRLRTRLDKYYATAGQADPLIIELPKGGYKPVFREREQAPNVEATETIKAPPPATGQSWWIGGALAAAAVLALVAGWVWVTSEPSPATVAVLPLESLSPSSDRDYFADGLTDEVIRNLSLVDGLTVRSRASSFALKGQRLNATDAGKQLDADFLVEGSVLHEGDRLRVNVALVRASDQTQLWSNRFDRTMRDVFALQDDISRGVANVLRRTLSDSNRRYEANPDAYHLYLRGRHAMSGFPAAGRQIALSAVRYFEEAIAKDPDYAIAFAGLADAFLAIDQNTVNAEAYRRAKTAAERAVALDPQLSEAQSALASIRARDYDWPAAERGYRRAIELNPNNALAHLQLGFSVMILQGRVEDGLALVHRALELDPLSPYMNTEVGRALLWVGQMDEAKTRLRHAIRLDPSRGRPYGLLSRALALTGNEADARAVVEDARSRGQLTAYPCAVRPEDGDVSTPAMAPAAIDAQGPDNGAESNTDDPLGVREIAGNRRGPSADRALAERYACRGDRERALDHLRKALAQHEPGLAELTQSPEWSEIRSEAAFATLRRQMRLPTPVNN